MIRCCWRERFRRHCWGSWRIFCWGGWSRGRPWPKARALRLRIVITMHNSLPRRLSLWLAITLMLLGGCGQKRPDKIIVGSKFFTEQVVLAELLAQHIEAHTGIRVERKTNLGGTLLVQKAMLAGGLDLYV